MNSKRKIHRSVTPNLHGVLAAVLAAVFVLCADEGAAQPAPRAQPPASSTQKAGPQPDLNATLRIGTGFQVTTLDPHNYRGPDLLFQNLIYDMLVDWDPKTMQLVPRLAESWQQIADTHFRFKLRKGVKFHDGTPLDAQAVKISFDRNRQALWGRDYLGEIAEIKVADAQTVDFLLKRPFATLLDNLALPVSAVMLPRIVQKHPGSDLAKEIVGTGPFKLVRWVADQELVLERNDDYWGEKPKLKRMVFKFIPDDSTRLLALKSGDLDVMLAPPAGEIAGLRKDRHLKLLIGPQARVLFVGFNFKKPPLDNLKLRQAVAHAINRKSIVEEALDGVPRDAKYGMWPPEIVKTDPPLAFEYNPAKARQLLAEAGFAGGLNVEFWTPSGRYFGDRTIAEVVKQNLAGIGITAQIKALEPGAFFNAITTYQQQMYLLGWGVTGHPDSTLKQLTFCGAKIQWTSYCDKSLDAEIVKASEVYDRAEQSRVYTRIAKRLMDQVVMVPIYYAVSIYVTSPKVHNLVIHPIETHVQLAGAWLEK